MAVWRRGLDEPSQASPVGAEEELGPESPVTDAGCWAVKSPDSPCDLLELTTQTLRALKKPLKTASRKDGANIANASFT